jgi:hypothetical protein
MESLLRGISIPNECLTQNTLDQSRIANQDPPQTKFHQPNLQPLCKCANPKPGHKLLYTPMTGEMKFLLDIPLP